MEQRGLGYNSENIAPKSMPRSRSKSTVNSLLKQASALSIDELKALASGVEGLLENVLGEVDEHGKPNSQNGYVESKMIHGNGPYRYLRYWDGKIHRSVYLGK
jgi:hypothetical protein